MNKTAPKASYWRSRPKVEEYEDCPRPESCLGGDENNPLGDCAEGYRGILCTNCAPGHNRSGFRCNKCPSMIGNIAIFFVMFVALVIVIALLVKTTLGGVEVKKPLYSVYYKIFMNHFQILGAVAQIQFNWPAIIQQILSAQQQMADSPG